MALQSSGAISISQIKTELGSSSNSLRTLSAAAGKSAPDAMSEFYGYSAYTPPTPVFPNGSSGLSITGAGTVSNPYVYTMGALAPNWHAQSDGYYDTVYFNEEPYYEFDCVYYGYKVSGWNYDYFYVAFEVQQTTASLKMYTKLVAHNVSNLINESQWNLYIPGAVPDVYPSNPNAAINVVQTRTPNGYFSTQGTRLKLEPRISRTHSVECPSGYTAYYGNQYTPYSVNGPLIIHVWFSLT